MSKITLDITQQATARTLFREGKDVLEIAQKIFPSITTDRRSPEYGAVRRLLSNLPPARVPAPPKPPAKGPVLLTEEQLRYIKENYKEENVLSLGKTLFPERADGMTPLHGECKAIQIFIKEFDPTFFKDMRRDMGEYEPPKELNQLCELITKASNTPLNPDRLSTTDKACIKFLAHNLASDRFRSCMDQLATERERGIFESEFVKATWDKPDLTPDEVNLYINLCDEYINRDRVSRKYAKLDNAFLEIKDPQAEASIKFSEMIKTVSGERDQAAKRIESLINKLNGDRSKRLKEKGARTVSITAAFEAFKSEEERRQMLRIAQVQREAIQEEQKNMEGMPAWKARILGIKKEMFE